MVCPDCCFQFLQINCGRPDFADHDTGRMIGQNSGGFESGAGPQGQGAHGNDRIARPGDIKDLMGGGWEMRGPATGLK